MKYTIEFIRHDDDGARKVLRRFASNTTSPALLKAKAQSLLRRARDANGIMITNQRGKELYNWRNT
jgi:hypothetical protein